MIKMARYQVKLSTDLGEVAVNRSLLSLTDSECSRRSGIPATEDQAGGSSH